MVSFKSLIGALAFSTSVPVILAHPGEVHDAEKHEQEMAAMRSNSAHIARGLEECASHPNFLRLKARGAARRAKRADVLRKERRVPDHAKVRRDETYSDQYAAASHNLTSSGYSLSSSADDLFATYKNVSCSLTPETTEGPYYITGEYYRSDLVESQSGVPMHLEIQYVDVNTCDVASGIYIEAWHCNATGVYSGVSVSGNGVGTSDPANLNRTFLRGVQSTDAEGVAAFDTIFPGHYTGRAVHIHLLSHQNGTIFSNGTFSSGTVQSVGQIGFDQTLISAVEETAPYNTNTQSLTANTADSILVGASDAGNDPYVDYAYLGDDISDGILAWIHVGFDSSASISVSPGAYFYGTGGVEGSSSSGGPGGAGGSGGPGNSAGPAPSGAGGSGGGPSIPAAVPTTAGSAGASVSAVASSGSSPYASAVGSAFQSVMSGSASISASGPTPSSSRAVQSVLSGSAALGSTVSGGAYGTRSSRAQSVQSSRVPSGARAGTGSNSGAKPSASDSSKPAQGQSAQGQSAQGQAGQGQSAQGQAGQDQSGQSNESHSTATTAAPVACGRA